MKNTLEKYGRIIALLHTLLCTIHSWQYAVAVSSFRIPHFIQLNFSQMGNETGEHHTGNPTQIVLMKQLITQ